MEVNDTIDSLIEKLISKRLVIFRFNLCIDENNIDENNHKTNFTK